MLDANDIIKKAGRKYSQLKGNDIPEIQSNQVKALAHILVEEINKELKEIHDKLLWA